MATRSRIVIAVGVLIVAMVVVVFAALRPDPLDRARTVFAGLRLPDRAAATRADTTSTGLLWRIVADPPVAPDEIRIPVEWKFQGEATGTYVRPDPNGKKDLYCVMLLPASFPGSDDGLYVLIECNQAFGPRPPIGFR